MVYPYTATDINPLYVMWWYLDMAQLGISLVLVLLLLRIKYIAIELVPQERKNGAIAMDGKKDTDRIKKGRNPRSQRRRERDHARIHAMDHSMDPVDIVLLSFNRTG
jgi:hypothetical protein